MKTLETKGERMIRHTGANMETVRRSNRAAILKYINDHGPASRKDLAEVLGLTPAAVTQICTDLFEEGILIETGINVKSSGAGRKKVLLDINFAASYVCAMTIEPEYTTVALADFRGEVVATKRCKTDISAPPEVYLNRLAQTAKCLMTTYGDETKELAAVGVGITGLVDKENGSSIKAYGIWDEPVEIAKILGHQFQVPVYIENNVNAFAMAELLYGTGKEHDNLMVIKWGPGVGCAIIIDQEIYEGRHAKAAELGHFIVEKNGALCKCGRRGCLETKVSYNALCAIAPFAEEHFGEMFIQNQGNAIGTQFMEAMDLFARSIVNSATIMAPNRIILTGCLFENPCVREALITACSSYDMSLGADRIQYSGLAQKEHYIGPVAICAKMLLYS